MPEKETLERARTDKRKGKAPSTEAGEFVREEIEHVREGKHGGEIHEAGDRDRAFQGPPGGRRFAASQERHRVRENAAQRGQCVPGGAKRRARYVGKAFACRKPGPAA